MHEKSIDVDIMDGKLVDIINKERPTKKIDLNSPLIKTEIREFEEDHPKEIAKHRGKYYYANKNTSLSVLSRLTAYYAQLKLILLFDLLPDLPKESKIILEINNIIREVEEKSPSMAITALLTYCHKRVFESLLAKNVRYNKKTNTYFKTLDWEKVEKHFSLSQYIAQFSQLPKELQPSPLSLLDSKLHPDYPQYKFDPYSQFKLETFCKLHNDIIEYNLRTDSIGAKEDSLRTIVRSAIELLGPCDEMITQNPDYYISKELERLYNPLYIIGKIIQTDPDLVQNLSTELKKAIDIYIEHYQKHYPALAKILLSQISDPKVDASTQKHLNKVILGNGLEPYSKNTKKAPFHINDRLLNEEFTHAAKKLPFLFSTAIAGQVPPVEITVTPPPKDLKSMMKKRSPLQKPTTEPDANLVPSTKVTDISEAKIEEIIRKYSGEIKDTDATRYTSAR